MNINIDYDFKNKNLLKMALTHTSFSHENRSNKPQDNERLEFLGDAVLELVISNHIFKMYPELTEGELTKLRANIVCESSLARVAKNMKIGENLNLGKGEEITGGRKRESITADAFEAIIGAIYTDSQDLSEAEIFIISQMKDIIEEKRYTFTTNDCKTYLQELIQKTSSSPIKYELLREEGPPHNKLFTAIVTHNNKNLGEGQGKSKKDAEQNAAFEAIKLLEKK
ncbi:MAG: ribonuclease III [bacterium]